MSDIEILDGISHIQKRPVMHIGDTSSPLHLLVEVIDNALDEVLSGNGNLVTLNEKNGVYTITDNGRGFPIKLIKKNDIDEIDSVIAATCEIFSGSKFGEGKSSIGMHGIGLTAVNALSTNLIIFIKKDNNLHKYYFKNAKFDKKEIEENTNVKYSTLVSFKPDKKYFESEFIDLTKIKKEFEYISTFKNVTFFINNVQVVKYTKDVYVKRLFDKLDNIFHINYEDDGERLDVYFSYGDKAIVEGNINLKFCTGTFISSFCTMFYNSANINKEIITKADLMNNFNLFIAAEIKDARYDSQTKKRMINSIKLFDKIKKQLELILNDEFFVNIFNKILETKNIKILSKGIKTGKRVSTDNPLKDCRKTPGNILYILEGDSAEGTLKSVRDPNTEAILPVNGKIINTFKNTNDKVLKGKFKYIIEAIGINIQNLENDVFRYNQVKIFCDADPDGMHIAVLLSIGIWMFAPKLVEQERLKLIIPPLFSAYNTKESILIYDDNIDLYIERGYKIRRFKGLGEMSSEEIESVIKNPKEITVDKIGSDAKVLNKIITDIDIKKRLSVDNRFSILTLLGVSNERLSRF